MAGDAGEGAQNASGRAADPSGPGGGRGDGAAIDHRWRASLPGQELREAGGGIGDPEIYLGATQSADPS
jgi:hypothetical protein